MANISDLSGDEREQRIAELKQKMQDAARQKQEAAAAAATQPDAESGAETETAPASADPVADVADVQEPVPEPSDGGASDGESEAAEAPEQPDAEPEPVTADATSVADEAVAVAAAVQSGPSAEDSQQAAQAAAKKEMNRREFITYSWGAAMGALLLGTGVVSFQFMYPRFKAGEFGGTFLMGPESSAPPTDAAPEAMADGKFWWVNVEGEGPQAIYMVCTHLGCLYKWVDERDRFECPCHGSKFTREGLYIEGPAPRSLDTFVTTLEEDIWVVDTGAKVLGAPASESSAAGIG
jgi:cytochrome b6-f complex iron-sulfur subunit